MDTFRGRARFVRFLLAAVVGAGILVLPAGPAAAVPAGAAAPTERCRLAAPFSLGSPACRGVRPGAVIDTRVGGCTMNFLFRGSDGRRYIGTAGHCILKRAGRERTWGPGRGPVARDGDGKVIGRFVYAAFADPRDFALVRLRKKVPARAKMCFFGGPTGINEDRGPLLVRLEFFGNGVFVRSVLAARSAWATGMPHPDHVFAHGVAAFGDSGAAVTSADGRAVGVLVTGGVHVGGLGTRGVDAGTIGIGRIRPQVDRAESLLGISLTLRTAPSL